MATTLRASQVVVEVLSPFTPKVAASQQVAEALVSFNANLETSQVVLEVLMNPGDVGIDVSQMVLEVLAEIPSGDTYDNSLTIAGSSACSGTGALSILSELSLTTQGELLGSPFGIFLPTLTVSGVSDVAQSGSIQWSPALTLSAVSDFTRAVGGSFNLSITVGSVGQVAGVGGLHYFAQLPVEGAAATSQVVGFTFADTLTVEGLAAIAQTELYVKNATLTVAGISDLTVAHLYTAGASLIVAGMADLARTGNRDSDESLTFNVLSVFFVENIYEFLYLLTSVGQVAAIGDRLTGNALSQSASGAMSVACTGVFSRTVTQTLVMTQLARALKSIIVTAQTLTMTQQATYSIIYTRSVSQTLTMTQQAVAFRECRQTLVLSQSVVCVKSKHLTVTQTLTLTETLHRNIIVGRVLSDTLVFFEGQPKDSGIGVDLTSPSAVATLVPRSCLVIIGVPEQTVILPCPQFGDSEAYQGQVNLKRTMTGDTYTYVRKGRVEKLQYTFHVGTHKAYEMQKYLLSHAARLHTVYNWKGEVWKVYITNNPVEFSAAERWQNKGERHEFTLELEGIKVS